MDTLQTFNFESNEVRTLLINNEPLFVGNDVAKVLGYTDTKQALRLHVDDEDKRVMSYEEFKGCKNNTFESIPNRGLTVVNESGLYSLIIGSKLPSAKKFKRWVTSEVLPTLRKTGQYNMTDSYMIKDPIERAKRWIEEQEEKKALLEENAELKPKALFADTLAISKGSISIGALAKILGQNGVDIGRNKILAWLRDNGYLMKNGRELNLPTQKYSMQGMGLFELKPNVSYDYDGTPIERKPTTYVTPKGQKYFINKFLKLEEKGEQ